MASIQLKHFQNYIRPILKSSYLTLQPAVCLMIGAVASAETLMTKLKCCVCMILCIEGLKLKLIEFE